MTLESHWQSGWQIWEPLPGVALDVFCAMGRSPGKTALITAGVHGDEYEGPAAVLQLTRELDVDSLSGTVLAIPVLNPSAFIAGTRTNPEDGLNLARCFPGNPNGKPTERLAAALFERLAAADYLIDLHSGGVEYLFLPLAGFYGPAQDGNPSFESARHFGLPYLWQLPETPGVLSREIHKRGGVAIGNEYLGAGQLSSAGSKAYCEGIVHCLAHWGFCQCDSHVVTGQRILTGDWQLAVSSGLFIPEDGLGERVRAGEVIARTIDMRGGTLQQFMADRDGVLAALRSKAFIRQGDWAVLLVKSKYV